MKTVYIPFMPRFREPLLNGTKTWTSRNKKCGEVGDAFIAFGRTFEITGISQKNLCEVIQHFREEGLTSVEEAIRVWGQIHPIKGYVPTQLVWVHEFRLKEEKQ